jgi:hypothetical protein
MNIVPAARGLFRRFISSRTAVAGSSKFETDPQPDIYGGRAVLRRWRIKIASARFGHCIPDLDHAV